MKTFKQFLKDLEESEYNTVAARVELFEHQVYRNIPGTKSSYREDPGNTNTLTLRNSHVYAKPNGRGRELYSLNFNGSGHDGSSGVQIPATHADFFRSRGYQIKDDNILESLDFEQLNYDGYVLLVITEEAEQ